MTEQTEVTQPRDDVRERKPVAWRYEYSVQYRNKMECTKNLAPLSILSEHRWSPEEARNYSETPLYTALATTTQPDPADVERMEADAAIDYVEGSNPAPKKHPHNELNWTGTPQSVVGFGDELVDAADSEPSGEATQ